MKIPFSFFFPSSNYLDTTYIKKLKDRKINNNVDKIKKVWKSYVKNNPALKCGACFRAYQNFTNFGDTHSSLFYTPLHFIQILINQKKTKL